MKDDITDNQLRDILKKAAKEAPENEWFVRKVMNRLPERRKTHNWILWCIYIAVASICCIGWGLFVADNDLTALITANGNPGQLLHLAALIGVTAVVIWQVVTTQLHSDHP